MVNLSEVTYPFSPNNNAAGISSLCSTNRTTVTRHFNRISDRYYESVMSVGEFLSKKKIDDLLFFFINGFLSSIKELINITV